VGTESPESIDATLKALNILRDFAGLVPVTFDPALNQKALAAALMMRAANDLSHTPDMNWPCYSDDGKVGAASSNLFLGTFGADAMAGYVSDNGVASLGHRRSALRAAARTMGTGSTPSTNALYVFGASDPAAPPAVVAWPPAGFVPWPLVFPTWSAAISDPGTVDIADATVAVKVGGQERTVSNLTDLGPGYGAGGTLSWKVALTDADRGGDAHVDVTIDNVKIDATPKSYAYAFDGFVPVATPTPTPSPSPGDLTPKPDPDTGVPPQPDAAEIAVKRLKLRGRKLKVRLEIRGAVDGTQVSIRVRAGKRSKTLAAAVRDGTVTLSKRLPRKLAKRKSKLRVVVTYPGDAALGPATIHRKV
jgi:hypothetical protein